MLQLLSAAVLWLCLLPSLLCGTLPCFYRPLMEKEKMFEPIVTECPPYELCFKADGRYGNYSALSARGCVEEKVCSQLQSVRFKGTVYSVNYACCDWPYCNSGPGISATPLSTTVTFVTVAWVAGQW